MISSNIKNKLVLPRIHEESDRVNETEYVSETTYKKHQVLCVENLLQTTSNCFSRYFKFEDLDLPLDT